MITAGNQDIQWNSCKSYRSIFGALKRKRIWQLSKLPPAKENGEFESALFSDVDNRWNQHPKTKSLFQVYYYFYFLRVLPVIGGLFSSFSAYGYLPDSVLEFPSREDFKGLMSAAGFSDPRHFDLTFGIATVYVGKRGSRSKPCCCVD
jgi:hypothetical protein